MSNEPIIINTIPDDGYVTIDIEDKVTSLAQVDNLENKLACTLRGLKSMIGEISNMASVYHNRVARTKETKQLYESYVDLLSVANGKAVDFAKTGVLYPIPRQISKWAKASGMPYFFKYNGPYYARLHNLSKAHSNMNLLCMSLERWERGVRWRKELAGSFDWHLMYDEAVGYDQTVFDEIELSSWISANTVSSNLSSKRNVATGSSIRTTSRIKSQRKMPKPTKRTGRLSITYTATSAS